MLYKDLPVQQIDCNLWAIIEFHADGSMRMHKYVLESMARKHARVNRIKWAILRWVFSGSGGQWGATVHEWTWRDIAASVAGEIRFRFWRWRSGGSYTRIDDTLSR